MSRLSRYMTIDPNTIQLLHVWNRCVRRAFLCGFDEVSGINYDYRRDWARKRLEHLASCFAIEVVTFAILSNHSHQVLRSRPDIAKLWDAETVAIRWLSLTPKRFNKDRTPKPPTKKQIAKIAKDSEQVELLRLRLSDVSWWMQYFSRHIAYRANVEDGVTGHFWESRFGSEVLEEERAVLACMIYVDLNPIRAQMAGTPEESDYTGAKERIDDLRFYVSQGPDDQVQLLMSSNSKATHDWERLDNKQSGWLCPIEIDEATDSIGADPDPVGRRASRKGVLPISLARYLKILDWTGRIVRGDKRGSIPEQAAPILERLGISSNELLESVLGYGGRLQPSFIRATKDQGSLATV